MESTVVWDLEMEREFTQNLTFFYEIYSAEDNIKSTSTALQYKFGEHFNAFVAIGYTEEHAAIIRPSETTQIVFHSFYSSAI